MENILISSEMYELFMNCIKLSQKYQWEANNILSLIIIIICVCFITIDNRWYRV
jgi:hypothetical protein